MKVEIEVDWIDYLQGTRTLTIMGEGHTKLLIIYTPDGKRTFRIENLEAK